MHCSIQDSQIVLLLNKDNNTSESTGDGCMIILEASDLPYVSLSRSAFVDVWRLQELKVSHKKSVAFIVYGMLGYLLPTLYILSSRRISS
jgi:hypothetical protein